VTKEFDLGTRNSDDSRMAAGTRFSALREVSLCVRGGECLGILGRNGSGKSTLLQLIAGILAPEDGEVHITGRVLSLLELGSGFDAEFTGAENVHLYGSVLGLSREAVEMHLEGIIEFSGLRDFMDVKLRKYSDGMKLRLAFSTAMVVNPDVLLVDEIIAVGDESFQRKCIGQFRRLKAEGKTIVLASHALGYLRELCDRLVLLENGRVVLDGSPEEVSGYYVERIRQSDYSTLREQLLRCESQVSPPQESQAESPVAEGGLFRLLRGGRAKAGGIRSHFSLEHRTAELRTLMSEFEEKVYERLDTMGREISSLEAKHGELASNWNSRPSEQFLQDEMRVLSGRIKEKERLKRGVLGDLNLLMRMKLRHAGEGGGAVRAAVELEHVLFRLIEESEDAEQRLVCLEQLAHHFLERYASETRAEKRAKIVRDLSTRITHPPWLRIGDMRRQRELWSRYLYALHQAVSDEDDPEVIRELLEHCFKFLNAYVAFSEDREFVFSSIRLLGPFTPLFGQVTDPEAYVERLASMLRILLHRYEERLVSLSVVGSKDDEIREMNRERQLVVDELVHVYKFISGNPEQRRGWGTGAVVITSQEILGADGSRQSVFHTGETLIVRMRYYSREHTPLPRFGIAIHDERSVLVAGPNSAGVTTLPEHVKGDGLVETTFERLPLLPGTYLLSVAVYDATLTRAFDHQYQVARFTIVEGSHPTEQGIVALPCHWKHVDLAAPGEGQSGVLPPLGDNAPERHSCEGLTDLHEVSLS